MPDRITDDEIRHSLRVNAPSDRRYQYAKALQEAYVQFDDLAKHIKVMEEGFRNTSDRRLSDV